jgi:hypothetical protein
MNIARPGYSQKQIIDALHDSCRRVKFRYALLDAKNQFKRDLLTVEDAEVEFDARNEIMRIAKFSLKDDGSIDFLNNRIQPFFCLKMPSSWVEWSLGIFMLASPEKALRGLTAYRDIEAYDTTLALKQSRITERLYFAAGTEYISALSRVFLGMGIYAINIEQTSHTLPTDREWAPGTSRLTIVNELLSEINYTPIYADELGVYTAKYKRDPSADNCEYIYSTDDPDMPSIIRDGAKERADYFNVPNVYIGVVSNPEMYLKSVYTNNNPLSPLSVANRGEVASEPRTFEGIANQAELDRKVELWAKEETNIPTTVQFPTALMPFHGYQNIIAFEHKALNVADYYEEYFWSMKLHAGEQMLHEAVMI